MGKKKGGTGNAAKPKKEQEMSNKDFDKMLEELSKATKENEGLKGKSMTKKEHKNERKEKLATIKREKLEQEEAKARSRAQLQQVMEMLQRQQMEAYPYLEEPEKKKEVSECEDAKHMVSSAGMQGWRRTMEDAHIAKLEKDDGYSLYAVFDGHSGADVAEYAAATIEKMMKATPEWEKKEYKAALEKAFMALDQDIKSKGMESGSTATVCLIVGDTIYTANAGDSRAIVSEAGVAKDLSDDHKPTNDVEKARIEKAGSTVEIVQGMGRVDGSLAVSRGFGDFQFKNKPDIAPEDQPVTAMPDVTEHKITKDTEFLVVACDGIWDCLTSQEVVDKYASIKSATKAEEISAVSCEVMDSILSPRPGMLGSDNMSMVVMKFKH
eukprot:TRINITY_DN11180_c0_g1_i1.p1 TRINITY_DN11180_c0_g1~~TRINITY_DN11180_c0_g1_i1.p1  ORF type:complete len:398 (+),score=178.71 TRINITY_DN11180_c0_g1_i1:53-1195(+)